MYVVRLHPASALWLRMTSIMLFDAIRLYQISRLKRPSGTDTLNSIRHRINSVGTVHMLTYHVLSELRSFLVEFNASPTRDNRLPLVSISDTAKKRRLLPDTSASCGELHLLCDISHVVRNSSVLSFFFFSLSVFLSLFLSFFLSLSFLFSLFFSLSRDLSLSLVAILEVITSLDRRDTGQKMGLPGVSDVNHAVPQKHVCRVKWHCATPAATTCSMMAVV